MSLDDKRTELLPAEKLGAVPHVALSAEEHAKNNLPDILARWRNVRSGTGVSPVNRRQHGQDAHATSELARPRTAQSFSVPKADIAAQGYDLSLNRYKEVVHEEIPHRPAVEILQSLGQLEMEIQRGMKELERML
jgi:type I restriction enzyme M protein